MDEMSKAEFYFMKKLQTITRCIFIDEIRNIENVPLPRSDELSKLLRI